MSKNKNSASKRLEFVKNLRTDQYFLSPRQRKGSYEVIYIQSIDFKQSGGMPLGGTDEALPSNSSLNDYVIGYSIMGEGLRVVPTNGVAKVYANGSNFTRAPLLQLTEEEAKKLAGKSNATLGSIYHQRMRKATKSVENSETPELTNDQIIQGLPNALAALAYALDEMLAGMVLLADLSVKTAQKIESLEAKIDEQNGGREDATFDGAAEDFDSFAARLLDGLSDIKEDPMTLTDEELAQAFPALETDEDPQEETKEPQRGYMGPPVNPYCTPNGVSGLRRY